MLLDTYHTPDSAEWLEELKQQKEQEQRRAAAYVSGSLRLMRARLTRFTRVRFNFVRVVFLLRQLASG